MKTALGIADSLGALSSRWLRRDLPHRRRAVLRLVRGSGFSPEMAEALLDALFSELTAPKLRRLLRTELPQPAVLDRFVEDRSNGRAVRAAGPSTILHVFSANVPNVAVVSFVRGLLMKSRNIGKLSNRDVGILDLWLASLKAHDRALWARCVVVRSRVEASALAKEAGLVVAYGRDESLAAVRKWVPAKTRFIGYGHRFSIALILRGALTRRNAASLARRTARDVWMVDQRGCLSPAVIFAQKGGELGAGRFAEQLAEALERLEKRESPGPRRTAGHWISLRRFGDRMKLAALRARHVRTWQSKKGRWAVGYDEEPEAGIGTGAQIVRVCGFGAMKELEAPLRVFRGSLQAASLEGAGARRPRIAEWLAAFGVNRICPAGNLQRPPAVWHQDGRPALADWLDWTGLESVID